MIALVAATVFVIALLVTLPARLLGYVMTGSGLIASDYSGTLWHGRAGSLALPVLGQYLQMGATQWRLSPLSVVMLSPAFTISSVWGSQLLDARGSVSPWGGVAIEELELAIDAGLARLIAPVKLSGDMTVLAQDLRVRQNALIGGTGQLVWRAANWQGNRSRQELGDYVLEFDITGHHSVDGKVSTLSGPVFVEGRLKMVGNTYSVDINLRSDVALSREFRSALELMAAPSEDGYHLKFATRM